jgi:hypothetical protein
VRINARGLPHSEIPGSKPVCGSPELIAAYHVLHRHLAPRHSPYALSSLTIDMRTNVVCWMFCIPSSGVNPSFGTLRVFCGRKKLPFAGYSIVKELLLSGGKIPRKLSVARDFLPRTPSAHFARGGPVAPLRSFANLLVYTEYSSYPQCEAGVSGPPPSANAGGIRKLVMENTGLEPVTSWLQTRRSPS